MTDTLAQLFQPTRIGDIELGSLLAEIGQQAGGFDLDLERDKTPAEPMRFE